MSDPVGPALQARLQELRAEIDDVAELGIIEKTARQKLRTVRDELDALLALSATPAEPQSLLKREGANEHVEQAAHDLMDDLTERDRFDRDYSTLADERVEFIEKNIQLRIRQAIEHIERFTPERAATPAETPDQTLLMDMQAILQRDQTDAACVTAMQDYLDKQSALRAATPPAEEVALRKYLWLTHGHRGLYGDDGEMQCAECAPLWDYRRMPIAELIRRATDARDEMLLRAAALAPTEKHDG